MSHAKVVVTLTAVLMVVAMTSAQTPLLSTARIPVRPSFQQFPPISAATSKAWAISTPGSKTSREPWGTLVY